MSIQNKQPKICFNILGSCFSYALHPIFWMDSMCHRMYFWVSRRKITGVLLVIWLNPIGAITKCEQYQHQHQRLCKYVRYVWNDILILFIRPKTINDSYSYFGKFSESFCYSLVHGCMKLYSEHMYNTVCVCFFLSFSCQFYWIV